MIKLARVPDSFRGVEGIRVHPCLDGKTDTKYEGTVILVRNARGQVLLDGVTWDIKAPPGSNNLWKYWKNLVAAEDRGN